MSKYMYWYQCKNSCYRWVTLHPCATSHLNQTEYFQQVKTHLTWTISCCVVHVFKSNSCSYEKTAYDYFPLTSPLPRMQINQDLFTVKTEGHLQNKIIIIVVLLLYARFLSALWSFKENLLFLLLVSNANPNCLHLFKLPITCLHHVCTHLLIKCIFLFDLEAFHLNSKNKYRKYCWRVPLCLFYLYLFFIFAVSWQRYCR